MDKQFACPICSLEYPYLDDAVHHFSNTHLDRILFRPEDFVGTHAGVMGEAIRTLIAGYIIRWAGILTEQV